MPAVGDWTIVACSASLTPLLSERAHHDVAFEQPAARASHLKRAGEDGPGSSGQ